MGGRGLGFEGEWGLGIEWGEGDWRVECGKGLGVEIGWGLRLGIRDWGSRMGGDWRVEGR